MSTKKEAKKSDFVKPCDIMRDNPIIYPGEAGSPQHFRQERRSTMNAKQEAEKYYNNLAPHVKQREGAKHIENLLKELEALTDRLTDKSEDFKVAKMALDALQSNLEATERKLAEAEKVADQFCDIYNESEGVTGLHLNGDVATWEWLRDNEWLDSLSDYEASKELKKVDCEGVGDNDGFFELEASKGVGDE